MRDISSNIVTRRYVQSSSFKMALLFTVMLGISAGILGYFLHDFGRQDFLRETEAALTAEISMLGTIESDQADNIKKYLHQRSQHDKAVHFRYENAEGIWEAGDIKNLPEHVGRLNEGVLRFLMDTGTETQHLAAKIHTFPDGSRIMVARDIGGLIASYERLKHLSITIMFLMLVVIVVSYAISHFVVSRINRIAVTAQHIVATGDLSKRITIDTEWDDLSNLAQVLNGFLIKIEGLMSGVREVSNNIAHDLRTPLTALRADIESLKGKQAGDDDLDRLLVEADRILSIFQSLLRISNIEKGKRHHAFTEVNVSTILRDVMDLYEPLAEEKGISFHADIPEKLTLMGDADLLFQMFANLLDNAIKFSNTASTVHIATSTDKAGILVLVKDRGIGIADAEKELVFGHFYRGDESRGSEGYGLGLSLVKAVVEKHQGSIELKDAKPGLEVCIKF